MHSSKTLHCISSDKVHNRKVHLKRYVVMEIGEMRMLQDFLVLMLTLSSLATISALFFNSPVEFIMQ